ncbi:MAG TPA: DUF4956 domain-containing protein [archaeon]|nr:DUF4956 domain-containing protein [archaeon]
MGKIKTFQQFLATSSPQIPLDGFVLNLLMASVLAFFLSYIYINYGKALSNRRAFSRNLVLLTMTTMLIITVVKSSLALSLGLVGALSIVRFRTAVKEPEELAYTFLAIAIGLGLGADQRLITVVAVAIIAGIIILRNQFSGQEYNNNLHLIVSSHNPQKTELEQIVETLRNFFLTVNLKRFEEDGEKLEAIFSIEFETFNKLNEAKQALQNLNRDISITFLDNEGVF